MMSIKLTIHPGRLTVLMKRTKDSVSQITEAARDSVSVVSIKAEDVLTQSRLQREIADLKEEIDLQMQAVGELLYATTAANRPTARKCRKFSTIWIVCMSRWKDIRSSCHSCVISIPTANPIGVRTPVTAPVMRTPWTAAAIIQRAAVSLTKYAAVKPAISPATTESAPTI